MGLAPRGCEKRARNNVPAEPAQLFWSIAVYDADTRCLIDNEQGRGERVRHGDMKPQPKLEQNSGGQLACDRYSSVLSREERKCELGRKLVWYRGLERCSEESGSKEKRLS